ncbi:hypothetical protein MGN70_010082 [Eutypa lata]|uniref:Prenylated rab acceptor 1 protein n=1 Tax=Eutypa lata (strain UCR-EL1) TaxID=1287681 RepID=M7T1G1_EUTLA|nr:hypothetical protein UCREL1_2569 [Eutypa lata UCREL1]KAI1248879.1 hypothetical protein MGN70_010082 [Eutypa lata]
MGFFGLDNGSVLSTSSKRHKTSSSSHKRHRSSKPSSDKSRSRSRSRSRHRKQSSGLANFLSGGAGGVGSSHYKKHSASRGSILGGIGEDSNYRKHSSSKGSFFGLGGGGNGSTRSFFGLGRSSSYYKRQPRANFVQKAYRKLKRLLRDLVYWAKRHPMKVFLLVIMPLITGGALTALLARFGLRLPPAVERMLGIAAKTAGGGSIGLMGEAVRMVSGGGGGSSGGRNSSSHYDGGYGGGYGGSSGYDDRNAYDYGYGGYDSGYGSRSGASTISVERGRDGDYQWERRREQDYGYDYDDGRSKSSSGGGFMGSVSRFFS